MNAEHVTACPARQTRHRTHDPTRRRHPGRPRRMGRIPRPAPADPTSPHQDTHRLPTAHLGDRPGQRRYEPASTDGAARTRHPTDDDPLRHPGVPTLRTAYDQAMGKMRRQFTLTPVGKPVIPDKMSWLNSEMLKTRVTHGYCSRHAAAGACPLRQHLRDLRQPRHRPRISRRDQQPDHRRPEPARRRTSPKLGQRSRPPRPRRRLPHRSPARRNRGQPQRPWACPDSEGRIKERLNKEIRRRVDVVGDGLRALRAQ
jgi:hypothetical protein